MEKYPRTNDFLIFARMACTQNIPKNHDYSKNHKKTIYDLILYGKVIKPALERKKMVMTKAEDKC